MITVWKYPEPGGYYPEKSGIRNPVKYTIRYIPMCNVFFVCQLHRSQIRIFLTAVAAHRQLNQCMGRKAIEFVNIMHAKTVYIHSITVSVS